MRRSHFHDVDRLAEKRCAHSPIEPAIRLASTETSRANDKDVAATMNTHIRRNLPYPRPSWGPGRNGRDASTVKLPDRSFDNLRCETSTTKMVRVSSASGWRQWRDDRWNLPLLRRIAASRPRTEAGLAVNQRHWPDQSTWRAVDLRNGSVRSSSAPRLLHDGAQSQDAVSKQNVISEYM
ncbi:hypothetical protein VSDG_04455 [Cytospora chrysosperma]|uniref:Uncharacterized protein n=1 Tax=Cytospora chrysosperma TaxID=252740 RepID=A0A423W4G1_CYTCH|nr:hypothetical protein VSDG_04455 [Valsa sordida]